MTSFKTETEKLIEKYSWLQPTRKKVEKLIELPSGDGFEEKTEWIVTGCYVNSSKLRHTLETLGFFNYEIGSSRFLLRVVNGIVEIWDNEKLRNFFDAEYIRSYPKDGVHDIPKEMLENKFLNSPENLLKESIIKRLQAPKEVQFLEDNYNTLYFPYQNGIVKVTETGIKLIPYDQSPGLIFKNSILPRDYTEKMKKDWQKGNWYRFLRNISNGDNEADRIHDFQTVVGYLMHHYFERKLKAIIFLDSRGDAENPKGRGGKSLLGKGLGHMLNADMKTDKVYCEIDGKNFDSQKATKYQEAEINTALIHLNDVERRGTFAFRLESVFNDVLEGIKVRKLYQMPFHVRTKMMISANHTFNTESGSTKDRFMEVQLSSYYDENKSPYEEFGAWFFSSDWDSGDWADFDNCMLHCVQQYLQHGLVQPKNINLDSLKAVQESSQDFIDYMENLRADGIIHHDCEIDKAQTLIDFTRLYPEYEWLNNKKKVWNKWLRMYSYYHTYFVRCTSNNLKQHDTQIRKSDGTKVRVFKYFFTEEWLKANTLNGR